MLTGFSLRPTPDVPDQTSPIDLSGLQFTTDPKIFHFAWTTPAAPPADKFNQNTAMAQLKDSLGKKDVGDARAALIGVLDAQKVPDVKAVQVDVSAMARTADQVLLSKPVLSYLGKETVKAA